MIEVPLNEIITLFPDSILKISIAVLIGLFMGLEREFSSKPAGVRTFSLVCMYGSVFSIIYSSHFHISLIGLAFGFLLLIIFSILMGVRGKEGLSLTTSTSLMVVYGSGILIGQGLLLEGITVAIISSALLALKRELHKFAEDRTREEIKSAVEFAVIAFVIYPVLPNTQLEQFFNVNPTLVWSLVLAVTTIGLVNYIILKKWGKRGFAVSGFFGGLVNSSAVVYDVSSKLKSTRNNVGLVMIANSSMIVRNAIIAIIFMPGIIIGLGIPFGLMFLIGIGAAYYYVDFEEQFDLNIESPFNLTNALKFGGFFLFLSIISNLSREIFGSSGFIIVNSLGGIVSSGSSTSSAVLLLQTGSISQTSAILGIIGGTIASILVKIIIAGYFNSKTFRPLIIFSIIEIFIGISSAVILVLIG